MEAGESLAYVAGFLDGEGCLMIKNTGANSSIAVQVTNSNEDVIHYINALLPGRIYGQKRYGKKKIYRLVWLGEEAVSAVGLLLPYLIVKRKQAEIILDYYDEIASYGEFGMPVHDIREKYRNKVLALNGGKRNDN